MGKRSLYLTLQSAECLMRLFPNAMMNVYAVAYITNDSALVQETPADYGGDINPTWNQPLSFTLQCSWVGSRSYEMLDIKLYNTLTLPGYSNLVGSVQIPLNKLLASAGKVATGSRPITWEVSTGGQLRLTYRLGPYTSRIAQIGGAMASVAADIASEIGINLATGEIQQDEDDDSD